MINIFKKKNIMIVGMDVYKDSSERNKSAAAFVASLDGNREDRLNCTRFYSKCELEEKGAEFNSRLHMFMRGAYLLDYS